MDRFAGTVESAFDQQRKSIVCQRITILGVVAQANSCAMPLICNQQCVQFQAFCDPCMVIQRPNHPKWRPRLVHRMQIKQPVARVHMGQKFEHSLVL